MIRANSSRKLMDRVILSGWVRSSVRNAGVVFVGIGLVVLVVIGKPVGWIVRVEVELKVTGRRDFGSLDVLDVVRPDNDPPLIVELNDQLLGEDLLSDHPAAALRGDDLRADRRQYRAPCPICVILVTKAAFEPATTARNLRGVERRFLDLGHVHRHRRHPRQVRVAADRLAAVAVVGQELGLVARLPIWRISMRVCSVAGQVLDQFAEIDALLGEIVEDDPFARRMISRSTRSI